jgi:hypothetical protein
MPRLRKKPEPIFCERPATVGGRAGNAVALFASYRRAIERLKIKVLEPTAGRLTPDHASPYAQVG